MTTVLAVHIGPSDQVPGSVRNGLQHAVDFPNHRVSLLFSRDTPEGPFWACETCGIDMGT